MAPQCKINITPDFTLCCLIHPSITVNASGNVIYVTNVFKFIASPSMTVNLTLSGQNTSLTFTSSYIQASGRSGTLEDAGGATLSFCTIKI